MLLLIDDDRELREALAEFLALHGYLVHSVADGCAALQWSKGGNTLPKLILLDLFMPVLDGWGFLFERRKDPRLARIPVVIMSGSRGIDRKAKEAGATAVMFKPVVPQELLRVIESFVTGDIAKT